MKSSGARRDHYALKQGPTQPVARGAADDTVLRWPRSRLQRENVF